MRVSAPSLAPSPDRPDRFRLSARIDYRSPFVRSHDLWFEFDGDSLNHASRSGNPWLVATIPLAFVTNEPLQIATPLDGQLLANARALMDIWSDWYPQFTPIPIEADVQEPDPDRESAIVGCLFAGGVDSFYTVLHDRKGSGGTIEELIFVHGADIPLANGSAFQRALAFIRDAASEWGLPVTTILTNLRQTRFELANWTLLSSGPLLAACALSLERKFRRVILSATWSTPDLHPLGSHPDTDPLFTTGATKFVHYGDWIDRVGKTKSISQHPIALQNLRVCWQSDRGENCGRCAKCLRTMATLEVLGKLESTTTFEADRLDLQSLRNQYIGRDRAYFRHLQRFAAGRGRSDIVGAIEAAFRRSQRINRFLLGGIIHLREATRLNPLLRALLRRSTGWLLRATLRMNMRLMERARPDP